jgi:WD40 repeat protein
MIKEMRAIVTVSFLISAVLPGLLGQEDPYIIRRESYQPGPSSINLSPDGKLLLAGYRDGSFRLLDPATFQVFLEVKDAHQKAVTAMDMPPKMDFILTAGGNEIKLWNRSGKHIGNFSGHATTIWNVDISNDGKYAVSSAFNKTFILWDVYNGVIAEYMRGHDDVTLSVAISPDNSLIASGSNDLTIRIWDLETRQVLTTLHGPTREIYDVAFSPDGRMLAAASGEHTIRVYDLENEDLTHLLKGHRDAVKKLAFSPEGRFLVSASEDHSLILWDVVTGDRIHTFLLNGDIPLDVVFHPDGGSFYSISGAGDLTRWRLDPEIFVLRYYDTPYHDELSRDTIFKPRRKGESKKDYQARLEEAEKQKSAIIDRYFQLYLKERER